MADTLEGFIRDAVVAAIDQDALGRLAGEMAADEQRTDALNEARRLQAQYNRKPVKKHKKADRCLNYFTSDIEKTQKEDFRVFVENLRAQMMREQVMSISIGVSPPSTKEARAWYKRHKKKLGYEMNVKHILIRVKGKSLSAERTANKKLAGIRKKIHFPLHWVSSAIIFSGKCEIMFN